MTNQEILNRFDVLYNNITSSQAPGLDGYEKSVFWNKATLEVLKNHLNPKGNKYGEGFDGTSKRQVEFSSLVTVEDNFEIQDNVVTVANSDRILAILNESAKVGDEARTVVVVPITHIEYDTLMSRPYKYPPKSQAWRVIDGIDQYRIISPETVSGYTMRYVRMPKEINLEDVTDTPDVPEVLHDEILQRAVELAKAAYVGDMNHQQLIQAMGERSE